MRRDFVTVDAGRRSRQRSDEHHPGCRQDDSGSMSQPGGRLKTRLSRLSRRLSSVLLAGTLVLSGTVAQASPRIELEFPTWQAEEPGAAQFWKEAKTAFEQTHPDVWINLYQVPFKDFTDKMTLRFASDNPPQIVQLPTRNVQQFAAQNWLAALDDFLARSDIPATYTRLGDDMQWNGKTIGVPLMEYGMVLFYNERLLKQAGVTYPTTEAQLLKAISATTDPARGTFGWGATTMQHPNIYTDWASWATAEGASLYKKGDYNFTDPKVVQAIDHLRIALRHAPSGVSTESARQLFLDGKIAMFRDGPWIAPLLKKVRPENRPFMKMGMMPFTIVPGGISNSIHIPVQIDAQRRVLVWQFIQMLSTPEWQARFALETGSPPPRRNALTPAQIESHPDLAISLVSLEHARNLFPDVPAARANFNQISQLVAEAGMRLINSDTPTASILADLQSDLQKRVPLR